MGKYFHLDSDNSYNCAYNIRQYETCKPKMPVIATWGRLRAHITIKVESRLLKRVLRKRQRNVTNEPIAGVHRVKEKRDLGYMEGWAEDWVRILRTPVRNAKVVSAAQMMSSPCLFPLIIASDKITNIQTSMDILQYLHGMGIQLDLLQIPRS